MSKTDCEAPNQVEKAEKKNNEAEMRELLCWEKKKFGKYPIKKQMYNSTAFHHHAHPLSWCLNTYLQGQRQHHCG